ncbi:MAG: protein-L-isoaspartate O-methyltransferase, partial [Candidatus Tectimicrobiota bacterium]
MPLERQRRRELVELLWACGDLTDPRVTAAFEAVPRQVFVPPEQQVLAYENMALPIGSGQTISQPTMVAVMTECLRVEPGDRV